MSCLGCRKAIVNEKKDKIRKLARKIAEIESRTQVLVERNGNLSIECEECWKKDGTGRAIEYFII
jgi:hypothetical protein